MPGAIDDRPFVLTLALDEGSRARFDAERSRHFPADRLVVGAHLTLFHALPAVIGPDVESLLDSTAGSTSAFDVAVEAVVPLGRGVAYRLRAPELDVLHRRLQRDWSDRLTKQDQQPLRAHVTVQNKVTPEQARATLTALEQAFVPWQARATGLALWRYDGGPWQAVRTYPLA